MTTTTTKSPSWLRRIVRLLIQSIIIALITAVMVEACFRLLERGEHSHYYYEGAGGIWMDDSRWGWKPTPGPFKMGTSEFKVTGDVNAMFMNEPAIDSAADAGKTRVMALGDSHTFASGVSSEDTWPNVLEQRLNSAKPAGFSVYNAATTGYNLHQHLLRLKDQGPILQPHYVVLGLSYATDFYDLLPPDHGGWIYGEDRSRDYFNLDKAGNLQMLHWEKPVANSASAKAGSGNSNTLPQMLRRFFDQFATFRYLRRSKLVLAIGSKVSIGGQSLWPNMEIIVEKQVSERHQYQQRLFEALLLEISKECERQKAKLIIVGIPYLPQVYDEMWNSTFGSDARFSRTAAIERVTAYCAAKNITYVDTLTAFQSKYAEVKHWLHHPKDAHPTAEGQAVIADTVNKAGLISPRSTP